MSLLEVALRARRFGLRPYATVVTEDGEELEAISFPFPRDDEAGISILAREKGDPTTMMEYRLPDEIADLVAPR